MTAVIIACGGKGKRMGEDKALAGYGGVSLSVSTYNRVKSIGPIYFSTFRDEKREKKIEAELGTHPNYLYDDILGIGPISSLAKAGRLLENGEYEYVFLAACDMPFIDDAFVKRLINELEDGVDAVVPVTEDGRPHPLSALYGKGACDIALSQIEKENYRVLDVFSKINTKYVKINDFPGRKALVNVNTKDALSRANEAKAPVYHFTGFSNSGKTTAIENLIRELSNRGVRCAYYKHTHHSISENEKGKDTERMKLAGAALVRIDNNLEPKIYSDESIDAIFVEGWKQVEFSDEIRINLPEDAVPSYEEVYESLEKIWIINQ